MLIQGVHRKRSGGVGRAGQDILLLDNNNDVRCVTASGPFCMIRVDRPALDGRQGALDISALVQGICMDVDLVS